MIIIKREITFILADCFAIDTLAYTAITLLSTKCVQHETLPRVRNYILQLKSLQYFLCFKIELFGTSLYS